MSEARLIKRYANRKLYDTQHSRYVTLDQISEMIRKGDDVKIIDNKTKEDLTSVTLAQIIFEEEKKQKSFLPLQAMRNIIQTGGESISQLVTEAQRRVTEAQRRVTNILPRKGREGEIDDEEVEADEQVAELADQWEEPAVAGESEHEDDAKRSRGGISSLRELREWVQHTQVTIEEWQKRMDGRIRHVVEGVSLSPFAGLQKDVKMLGARIAELEAKLAQIARAEREASGQDEGAESSDESTSDSPAKVDEPSA